MTLVLPTLTPLTVAAYLAIVNALAFGAFALDKRAAGGGGWRTPEAQLLGFALAGGSPAAYAARHLFRHKTQAAVHPSASYDRRAAGGSAGRARRVVGRIALGFPVRAARPK